jgi:hypothetical protein
VSGNESHLLIFGIIEVTHGFDFTHFSVYAEGIDPFSLGKKADGGLRYEAIFSGRQG